ncbi:hypothetical protein AB0M29_43765 [Streptomyces sp. NPDC051976]|uniref:hypothetical protein n=1 Tax=Streptomyces sp. NPDC051976 TaxID=3154947 RepID=UPI00343258F8
MLSFVDLAEIEQLRASLREFVAEVFGSLKRKDLMRIFENGSGRDSDSVKVMAG